MLERKTLIIKFNIKINTKNQFVSLWAEQIKFQF